MRLWNLTYNDPRRWAEVHAISGKPLGFWASVKAGGTGSPRAELVGGSGELDALVGVASDRTGCNFERTAQEGRDYGILPDVQIPVEPEVERDIHVYLRRYGPPIGALPALEAWQEREGLELIDPHPEDPQLRAALDLFAGLRHGPELAQR